MTVGCSAKTAPPVAAALGSVVNASCEAAFVIWTRPLTAASTPVAVADNV